MLVPISWLKEYVDIKLPLKQLMWKMTEAGLTCESYKTIEGEIILDVEVTPNRPDWMSIVGIAREIAAITHTHSKNTYPKVKITKIQNPFKITIKPNYQIVPRIVSVIIRNVSVKPSPPWLKKRITQIGLRPINNLVDITNYVLWTHGGLLHAFDYDKIAGHEMTVALSKGSEPFRSLDGIDYQLPKGAIIIRDQKRIIDLLPLKGSENTASFSDTKKVLLHSIICDPVITRRTSQALKLRSDSSAIAERGLDPNGCLIALNHALSLILELAGGEVASEIIDHKAKEFTPWNLNLNLLKLEKILGIKIPREEVMRILTRLNLSPKLMKEDIICLIPTYRGDLKIEEDLIEEVARLYGYNNFPKTLPVGNLPSQKIPYHYNRNFEMRLKQIATSFGFDEAINLSLVSQNLISKCQLPLDSHIKIANPVSLDYEYLRTTLIPGLLSAVKLNADYDNLKLFEYGKTYLGPLDTTSEPYKIAGVEKGGNFLSVKGVVDYFLENFNIAGYVIKPTLFTHGLWHPITSGVIEKNENMIGVFGEIHPKVLNNLGVKEKIFGFELDIPTLTDLIKEIEFKEIPKYPPQIEDITLVLPAKVTFAQTVQLIKISAKTVSEIRFIGTYKNSITLRISYLNPTKTMEDQEVKKVRDGFLKLLKRKYRVLQKK